MKKNIIFVLLALITVSASSENFIAMPDSVRIKPACLDGYSKQVVYMVTDAYCDKWSVDLTYPDGLSPKLVNGITPLEGMVLTFLDVNGQPTSIEPDLWITAGYVSVCSQTSVHWCFYDYNNDGVYEPAGSVKWEPGVHRLFEINLYIDPEYRSGYMTFDATFDSAGDGRGPVLSNVHAYKTSFIWIGYMPGDVTGNEKIDISDVVELTDYILGKTVFDEFSAAAADYNRDGVADVDDVTMLINAVLG